MGVLYNDAIASKSVPSITVLGRIAALATHCDINIADKDIGAISDKVKPLYAVSDFFLSLYTYIYLHQESFAF